MRRPSHSCQKMACMGSTGYNALATCMHASVACKQMIKMRDASRAPRTVCGACRKAEAHGGAAGAPGARCVAGLHRHGAHVQEGVPVLHGAWTWY